MTSVAVVGGGLGGLCAAYRLVKQGHDVTLFEKEADTGGVIKTERVAGFLHEFAAASFLGSPEGAQALCAELGVPTVVANAAAKERFVYVDGALHKAPRGPLDLIKTDLLTWRGKLALLREPFVTPWLTDATRDESVHAFATRRFGPEAARVLVAPMVTGVFAADSHHVSVRAGFSKLADMDARGGIVRSVLRSRGGFPKLTTVQGGMGGLVGALRDQLAKARVHTSTPVERLTLSKDAVRVWTAQGDQFFDAVVAALPARQLMGLIDEQPELVSQMRGMERAPVAVVCIGVPAASLSSRLGAFGVVVASGETPRVLGVVFESTVWPERAPEGQVLLRCIVGGARDPEAVSLDDESLVQLAITDLSAMFGVPLRATHSRVIRWTAGIAQYSVGHKARVERLAEACARQRLYLAGADYWGVGVNDVIVGGLHAGEAAGRLASDMSRADLS